MKAKELDLTVGDLYKIRERNRIVLMVTEE